MASVGELEQQLKAAHRLIAIQEAREHLLPYLQLLMPHPEDPDDARKSLYQITPQAKLLAEIIERVDRGELKRVAVSIGPQMGKSQILSRAGPAWLQGRRPTRHLMLGSYNQDFANDFGQDVRTIIKSHVTKQVFPELDLRVGGGAADHLVTTEGGKMAFVGIGGSGSGKPADVFVVDDPYRNETDAASLAYRETVWNWFQKVVMARAKDRTAIIVVHTRWNQDDLIGRLVDLNHPERHGLYEGIEEHWTHFNIPAVIHDPTLADALGLTLETPTDPRIVKQFGSAPVTALWPGEKSLPLLAEVKQADVRTFESLYQGKPSPDDGTYFKTEYILPYNIGELPKSLRYYGASDHAVSAKQSRDLSCLGCIGVDENDEIWVLPDLVWRRMETDVTVQELITQFKAHKPTLWWMENELISKSFGPFLRKEMRAHKTFPVLDPVTPMADLEARARAIQGFMANGMVHFPVFAPWFRDARAQMLMFPAAPHDDFVAWLALIGLGLNKQVRARGPKPEKAGPTPGSMQWVLERTAAKAKKDVKEKAKAGW